MNAYLLLLRKHTCIQISENKKEWHRKSLLQIWNVKKRSRLFLSMLVNFFPVAVQGSGGAWGGPVSIARAAQQVTLRTFNTGRRVTGTPLSQINILAGYSFGASFFSLMKNYFWKFLVVFRFELIFLIKKLSRGG